MRHLASVLVAAALLNMTPATALDHARAHRAVEAVPTDRLDIEGNKPVFAGAAARGPAVLIMADYSQPEGSSVPSSA